MMQSLRLAGRTVDYTLRISRRAKRLRLAVYQGGQFIVTAPARLSLGFIERFIVQKSAWVLEKIDRQTLLPPPVRHKSSRADFLKYKAVARKIAKDRMQYFNTFYNFSWKRVSIKNQRTRWGSCSKQGNINFNYKIALLPPPQADYVVVHEMCHLAEMNHSKKFWQLVARTVPNYMQLRKELKKF